VFGDERVQFLLEEQVRREDPPPEPVRPTTRKRERDVLALYARATRIPPDSSYSYHSTGRLTLRLLGLERTGAHQNFAERRSDPGLDRRLGEVLSMFQKAAVAVKERREEVARRDREWEVERRRREDHEKEARRQEERFEQMSRMHRRWRAARDLREFVAAVEVAVPPSDRTEEFKSWLVEAHAYAEALDPLTTPGEAQALLLKYDPSSWLQEVREYARTWPRPSRWH
jgi:hypothetical protein